MKFNWGWGIVLFVLVFVTFILNLVYRCSQQQVDLVSEKYYENEIKYQQHINREVNTHALSGNIKLENAESGLTILYPPMETGSSISGDIELFKPDDAKKDMKLFVNAGNEGRQIINKKNMAKGWWNVKINWAANGTPYYFEQRIFVD